MRASVIFLIFFTAISLLQPLSRFTARGFSPSFLAAYSLTMINILTYLERSGSSFWRSASALTLISNLKLWIVIIAFPVLIHYLVQFSFFPTNMRFNKSFSFTFYNSNSVSFSINITVFMPFTYQVLLLRSILFVLYSVAFGLFYWMERNEAN